ncbi:hypothetical protein AALP_AA3G256000 [Arabis alpina]|uniref:RNase H type-1 domain-containing protein n=1 Tax=Arabis alpina TaxID=50452 RepID=A0A087HBM5_ARAAL|nr:hypothetical protein AALP_AA3G256000 [Arabis alpina]
MTKVLSDARECMLAQDTEQTPHKPILSRTRDESDTTRLRCYTNAPWRSDTNMAGLAWVLKDPTSRTIFQGSSTQSHINSPLMAETMAIREALIAPTNGGFYQLQMASDANNLHNDQFKDSNHGDLRDRGRYHKSLSISISRPLSLFKGSITRMLTF